MMMFRFLDFTVKVLLIPGVLLFLIKLLPEMRDDVKEWIPILLSSNRKEVIKRKRAYIKNLRHEYRRSAA